MTHPRHREVRITVYSLKREHGQPITLCRTSNNTTNFETGVQAETLHKIEIRRAAFLPAKALRSFSYDLSFIAANKNFTLGGYFDHRNKRVLIDRRDINRVDATWPLDLNMHVLYKEKRWEIKEIYEYDDEECILLILDGLTGAAPLNQTDVAIEDTIELTDGFEVEP